MQHSTRYIVLFAVGVCLVCALFVASSAVFLKPLQERNVLIDRQEKVLTVAGLIPEGADLSAQEIMDRFDRYVKPKVIDLETGEVDPDVDPKDFDQQAAKSDPETSEAAPQNDAGILRLPTRALVFDVVEDGKLDALILPIEGKGLWSTLYGYIALAPDANTIVGITFYQHGETPGLGGEIDNPRWKALWPGRKAFDRQGRPVIRVKKGTAGSVDADPHEVDGLSGATMTSRGVTHLVQFWLGQNGFGPYIERYRQQTGVPLPQQASRAPTSPASARSAS